MPLRFQGAWAPSPSCSITPASPIFEGGLGEKGIVCDSPPIGTLSMQDVMEQLSRCPALKDTLLTQAKGIQHRSLYPQDEMDFWRGDVGASDPRRIRYGHQPQLRSIKDKLTYAGPGAPIWPLGAGVTDGGEGQESGELRRTVSTQMSSMPRTACSSTVVVRQLVSVTAYRGEIVLGDHPPWN